MTTLLETETGQQRADPPTRELIERARREQWRVLQDLRRRILGVVERRYED